MSQRRAAAITAREERRAASSASPRWRRRACAARGRRARGRAAPASDREPARSGPAQRLHRGRAAVGLIAPVELGTARPAGARRACRIGYNVRLWIRGSSPRSAPSSSGELLAGGGAARRHAARGQPAGALAREAARHAAARPLRPPRRADRGRAAALPRRAAAARARGAARRRRWRRGRGRARRRALDRRVDRARRRSSCRCCSASSSSANPGVHVSLDGGRHAVGRRRVARAASSSSASSAPRGAIAACASSRSSRDEVISPCPPGHPFAGPDDHARRAARRAADRHAGGRGRPADRRGRAAARGLRLRDLDVRLELGLQESVRSAVQARLRRHLHLAHGGRVRSRGRDARRGAGRGLDADAARSRSSARRPRRRRARPRRSSSSPASGSTDTVVRFGPGRSRSSARLAGARHGAAAARDFASRAPGPRLDLPVVGVFDGVRPHVPVETVRRGGGTGARGRRGRARRRSAAGARSTPRRRSSPRSRQEPVVGTAQGVAVPTTYAGAEWTRVLRHARSLPGAREAAGTSAPDRVAPSTTRS